MDSQVETSSRKTNDMEITKTVLVWGQGLDWGRCRGLMGKGYKEVSYIMKAQISVVWLCKVDQENKVWNDRKARDKQSQQHVGWGKACKSVVEKGRKQVPTIDSTHALRWWCIGVKAHTWSGVHGWLWGGGIWCPCLLVMVTALIGCAHVLHRDNFLKCDFCLYPSLNFSSATCSGCTYHFLHSEV